MGRSKKQPNQATPVQQVSPDNREVKEERYVVVREGYRVSAIEYSDPKDPKAIEEMEFWRRVETNHSWGGPVEIVKYNNKLHRVW